VIVFRLAGAPGGDVSTTWPRVSLERSADYNSCFGCGKDNPIGLKLSFQWDGKTARAEFTPTEAYQGWPGLVHGGIMACLLDEGMGYAALFDTAHCLTARMEVKLKRPAIVGEPLVITSSIKRKTRKLIETVAAVTLEDGTVVAEGTGTHYVVDRVERERLERKIRNNSQSQR
jgi:acyl-coenzyme A thioesterase PaaI-like protein